MNTYTCNKCNKIIEITDKENHELKCIYSFNNNDYNNLIPCEYCNNYIEFESYNDHIYNCNTSNLNNINFLSNIINDYSFSINSDVNNLFNNINIQNTPNQLNDNVFINYNLHILGGLCLIWRNSK